MCLKNQSKNKYTDIQNPHCHQQMNKNYLKSCSSLVGGFVGTKSQNGSNRGWQLIWEFVITQLEIEYREKTPSNYFCIYNSIPKLDKYTCSTEQGSKKLNNFEHSTDLFLDKMLNKKNKKNRNHKSKENMKPCEKFKKTVKNCKTTRNEMTLLELENNFYICDNNTMETSPETKTKLVEKSSNPGSTLNKLVDSSDEETMVKRPRRQSDCSVDSDDSLIIFDSNNVYIPISDKDYEFSLECLQFLDENDSDSEEEDEIEEENEIDSNDDWENDNCDKEKSPNGLKDYFKNAIYDKCKFSSTKTKKGSQKVRFADDQSLVKIHSMIHWDYAYRQARIGKWEQCARDRERFAVKINKFAKIISPILDHNHRDKIFLKYHSNV